MIASLLQLHVRWVATTRRLNKLSNSESACLPEVTLQESDAVQRLRDGGLPVCRGSSVLAKANTAALHPPDHPMDVARDSQVWFAPPHHRILLSNPYQIARRVAVGRERMGWGFTLRNEGWRHAHHALTAASCSSIRDPSKDWLGSAQWLKKELVFWRHMERISFQRSRDITCTDQCKDAWPVAAAKIARVSQLAAPINTTTRQVTGWTETLSFLVSFVAPAHRAQYADNSTYTD